MSKKLASNNTNAVNAAKQEVAATQESLTNSSKYTENKDLSAQEKNANAKKNYESAVKVKEDAEQAKKVAQTNKENADKALSDAEKNKNAAAGEYYGAKASQRIAAKELKQAEESGDPEKIAAAKEKLDAANAKLDEKTAAYDEADKNLKDAKAADVQATQDLTDADAALNEAEEDANTLKAEVSDTENGTSQDSATGETNTQNEQASIESNGYESYILAHPFFNGSSFVENSVGYTGTLHNSQTVSDETQRNTIDQSDSASTGLAALINPFAIMTLKTAKYDLESKKHYRDGQESGSDVRWYDIHTGLEEHRKDPETRYLIADFGNTGTVTEINKKGAMPYNFADFAYCKWFGKISNNHLITLRRFTHPVNASLDLPDWEKSEKDSEGNSSEPKAADFNHIPVAQAVTWFGQETGNELSSFMNFSAGLNWEDLKSEVNSVSEDQSDNTSASQGGFQRGMFKFISVITGEGDLSKDRMDGMQKLDPYGSDGPYANRILGPVNCIDKTMKRGRGFTFDQKFAIKFHYSARSIDNVNTKAAMLDIIGNMLVLTYGVGAFWGGMNRCVGSIKAYPWKEGMRAWFAGDPLAFMKAMKHAVNDAQQNIKGLLDDLAKNPVETLKKIAGMGAKAAFGNMVSYLGDHPQQAIQYKSLLTGEPVGEWHLVIGNPYNPIMTIGNLVCKGCQFEFGKDLGPDDFPTELTCTITLEHASPLDRIGIESMFNRGWGRVYTVPTEVDNTSASRNSKVDTSWNRSGGKSNSTDWASYWDQLCYERGQLHNARASALKSVRVGNSIRGEIGDVWRKIANAEGNIEKNSKTLSK